MDLATRGATMDHREFEAVVDEFGASAKDLVDLVEQARYEQPTAIAISRLLDAREDLLALIARLPALRAVDPPVALPVALADLRARIAHARAELKTNPDSKEILQLVTEVGETFAAAVAPLQAQGRWPKSRSRS
jgi:hypothetical protein